MLSESRHFIINVSNMLNLINFLDLTCFSQLKCYLILKGLLLVIFDNKLMKGFSIAELLIYDPKRPSPKRKPIEIEIQEAKILIYWPKNVPIEQKCNTVGMAEGVYSFCNSLITPEAQEEGKHVPGWQTIVMEECVLILSEVEEDIWIFVRLDHDPQSYYDRQNTLSPDNGYLESVFSDKVCRSFMECLYGSIRIWYGPIRGWVFKQRIEELEDIMGSLIVRFQEVFAYEGRLDVVNLVLKDVRLIPLDINSTLKFLYFRNVLQSHDPNISHIAVFSNGLLAYSSLSKDDTQYFANYLYAIGQPYAFSNVSPRLNYLPEVPKSYRSHKFGFYYNSRIIGGDEGKEWDRSSVSVINRPASDLLGFEGNRFELFEVHLRGEEIPLRLNFYLEGTLLFLTFFKQNPEPAKLLFQNRFYHDNADKFLAKINESLIGVLKPSDPYRFLFHNAATYSGKSTIREWKLIGRQIREAIEVLLASKEALILSLVQGYWIYGLHRFCRILVLLVPSDIPLIKVDEYVSKMTKEYFSKAYI